MKKPEELQKILILAAIPQPHNLRLDKEIREIRAAIERAKRDVFEIHQRTAVRPQDIRRAMSEVRPQIVHFCGHGMQDGSLVLEDDSGNHKPVSPEGLAALFQLHAEYVNCVLLNACYSEASAKAISQYINYTIGMNQPIQDRAAIVFAQGFYDGLGYKNSDNQDIFQRAFDEGVVAMKMENIVQGQIPVFQKTHQMENRDTTIDYNELYHALSKLGYQKQVLSFIDFIETQSIAGFLIHGSPEHGQRWLLNRLMRQYLKNGTTSKVLKVELHRIGRRSDVNTLWRELGGRVGLKRQNSPSEIIERVYQWWQTQNVILIFHDVDCMPEDYLRKFIQDFWLPLATKARESVSQSRKFRLLMFFVDYEGCVGNWDTLFVEQVEPNQGPKIPIKLPIINPFCQQDLDDWIKTLRMEFFDKLLLVEVMRQKHDPVQEILDNSNNGIPELAFSEICDWSGCNWYETEKIWLIH